MQLLKYLILLILFVITTIIGVLISQKYSNRVKSLKQMKSCLNLFKTKIQFTYEPLPNIFNEIAQKVNTEVGKIFSIASQKMKLLPAGIAWEQSIEESNTNINKEDKDILKTLSKLLGQTDIDGQLSQIELVSNFLEEQILQASMENSKNSKLYKKLGVIIGIALVIILI